ncbi:MAG: hypothetical protein JWO36_5468 [Myxococcales bacterium]|nr:hypothetical protein [Myxococcales bacterium]
MIPVSNEAPHLIRLSQVLAERQTNVEAILTAVTVSGTSSVYLTVSALSRRIDLMIPYHPDALAAIAPHLEPPQAPPRAMLRIFTDGDRLDAGLVIAGPVPARDAVDQLAPAPVRDAWLAAVDKLLAVPGAGIISRVTFLTKQRGVIGVGYPDREPDAEDRFLRTIDEVAGQLGVAQTRLTMWKALHPTLGPGALSVLTECTPIGPAPQLGFLYGNATWDQAVTVANKFADPARSRQIAAGLGTLAGALQSDEPRGLQIDIGPAGLDVSVWIVLRPS